MKDFPQPQQLNVFQTLISVIKFDSYPTPRTSRTGGEWVASGSLIPCTPDYVLDNSSLNNGSVNI